MDRRTPLVIAVGLLAVVATLYAHLAIVVSSHPPAPPPQVEEGSAPASLDRESAARLDRIEHALQGVSEDLAALRADRAKAAVAAPAPGAGATLEGRPVEGKPAAEERAAGAASKDGTFAGVSNEDLRLEAKALAVDKKDLVGSIRRWEAPTKRNLSRDERAEAMLQAGLGYWTLQELDTAVKGFRDVIDFAGADSDSGTEAGRMLGWALLNKKDARGALEAAQRVARSPSAPPWRVGNARYVAALSWVELKEDAAARREFEGIVADYGANANDKWMVDDAKKRLESMK